MGYPYTEFHQGKEAPMVNVNVVNSRTREQLSVPALLDTGSEITCIPIWCRRKIFRYSAGTHCQIKTVSGEIFGGRSVNMTISVGGTALDNIEAFVLDLPYALIGRDVLDHFRITFDGPAHEWFIES